jgi:cytochrome P450
MQSHIPTYPGHFLTGIMSEFRRDSLEFLLNVRKYGDIVQGNFGPFPLYFLNSPELIHDVLVENASSYHKSRVVKDVLKPSAGNGIFTSDGDFWRRQRKLAQPAFHTRRIGSYADTITRFSDETAETWRDGETRMIDEDMMHLTMRIICKVLFDAEVKSEVDHLGGAMTFIFKLSDDRFNQLPAIPYWLPTRLNRMLRENIAVVDQAIQGFIDERRASGTDKGDLLSMLLEAQDEDGSAMTDRQVRDEAMTLFGAGHETTAVTLMWTWYLLSQNPDVEAQLHQELDEVLGGRLPALEDLGRLRYTEMVIKESMRLYPPAWGTSRQPIEDVMIGRYPVRKGSSVFLNIYGMHRDERYFPDADRFDPERFSPEREKSIPKHAYIPFGGGPRVCIGNAFAMMEAKLVLAVLAQRYRLELAPGHLVKPQRQFTLRSAYGMKMIVRQRTPALYSAHDQQALETTVTAS